MIDPFFILKGTSGQVNGMKGTRWLGFDALYMLKFIFSFLKLLNEVRKSEGLNTEIHLITNLPERSAGIMLIVLFSNTGT